MARPGRARGRAGRGRGSGHGGAGGFRGCAEAGCDRAARRGSRWCRVHATGEVARAEDRGMRALLADLAAVGAGPAVAARREGELWRRAARGDYGDLLDERLAEIMAAGEDGRLRGLVGQLIGAVAIALDGVMTEEDGDATARSLAVSRLAQATTRIVGARERLAAAEAARGQGLAREALETILAEVEAEEAAQRAREREQGGASYGAAGWGEWGGEDQARGEERAEWS